MTSLMAVPDTFTMSIKEKLTLGFDFANYLTGQTVSSGATTLTNKLTAVDASAALGAASISGTKVNVLLTGSTLLAGSDYLLIATATLNTGDIMAMELIVKMVT